MAVPDIVSTRGRRNAELFLAALLGGVTVEAAAASVGISTRTAYRYLADVKFQQAFRDQKKAVLDRAVLRLTSAVDDALTTMISIHKSDAMPPASRAQCAIQLCKAAFANVMLSEIEDRLHQLEQRKGTVNMGDMGNGSNNNQQE